MKLAEHINNLISIKALESPVSKKTLSPNGLYLRKNLNECLQILPKSTEIACFNFS